jgi:hypothetical protein
VRQHQSVKKAAAYERRLHSKSRRLGSETTHATEVVRRFGDMRAMHNGLPNHAAECLLKGLKAPIPAQAVTDQVSTVRGRQIRRQRHPVDVPELLEFGLMERIEPKKDKLKRPRARTNFWGFVLLRHWSETRKGFKPFFEAYCDQETEQRLRVEMMLRDPTARGPTRSP